MGTGLIRGIPSRSVRTPLRLIAVPSCPLSPLHDKDFYNCPATCRWCQQFMSQASDNPPSNVVGILHIRPGWPVLFLYID